MKQLINSARIRDLAERMENFAIELDEAKSELVLPNTPHAKVIRAVDVLHEAVIALRGE